VPQPEKPRQRSGYRREETQQVESACLTVAVTLGALMDDLCIVGGLVPSLIIDRELGGDEELDDEHPGTNDLDIGISVALLDDDQYTEISHRLRQEGFEPDGTPLRSRLERRPSLNWTVNSAPQTAPPRGALPRVAV
jgi:hypothetical protein